MPTPLTSALVLVHTLFAITIVGGVSLLLTASSYDDLDGAVLALVAYAAAPGTVGWWLARRSWEGGVRVWRGLVAVQVWLILTAVANLAGGSARGGMQLVVPVLTLLFLLRPESRRWYELPELDRVERRPFSPARMIRWRRDDGQTAVEYAGLVAIVVALVTALLVSGLGTQIYGGIEAQVCKVTGMGCAAPSGGGTDVTAGNGDGQDNTQGSSGGTTAGNGNGDDTRTADNNGNGSDNPDQKADDDGKKDGDEKKDDGCFSGFGAFFGCAGNQIKQVGQGLFVDGIWGDLTGIYDMVRHPLDTLSGIGDYGKQLGSDWMDNSKDARDKWSKGDYLGAVLGWGGASLKTGGTVLYDMFIGDDVADQWNNGNKTRAVTTVLWNVGSLFIPGYDVGKVVEKVGVLGKLGKLGKLAEKAGKAAEDAKKAAKAGDVAGAEKAAKEADDAAEEAEKKAKESGCTISAPGRRIPYDGAVPDDGNTLTGSSGTGTTVLAAGGSPYVVLADDGCDEDAKKEAEEARKQADEADKAADRWQAGDDVAGPAAGKTLKFPNKRHTVGGSGSGQVKERNTVILRGNEDLVRADIEGIAKGRADLLPDGNTYEINGRQYRVEDTGTVFPVSGPGLVDMDRIEYAALKEIARNKGDLSKSQQLQRDPKFVNNPDKVAKAKQVYDGTYK
ncbi:Flp family type IVb pilin [Streptomyces sp. NBC_00005]|uniref:Flp family type IVb pilin n=1 Tax=Streptomyces sp. NBC_00005 TaxID=2903609 RepID=UPI0032559548